MGRTEATRVTHRYRGAGAAGSGGVVAERRARASTTAPTGATKVATASRSRRFRVVDIQRSDLRVTKTERRRRYWTQNGAWLDQGAEGSVTGCVFTAWLADRGLRPSDGGHFDEAYAQSLYRDTVVAEGRTGDAGATLIGTAKTLHQRGVLDMVCKCKSVDVVVRAVLERGPIVFGCAWRSSMFEPTFVRPGLAIVRYDPNSVIVGGHAILLNGVDLDLTIDGVTGFFRLKNSWGRGWGDHGGGYISIGDIGGLLATAGDALLPVPTEAALGGVPPMPSFDTDEEPSASRLPGFQADDVLGDDLLGIDREVDALCSIVVARDVRPPLSIGLFGDWGSGKSFFMRRMQRRVDDLSERARASETTAYCEHVRQITFNAWHYADSNLWASLATHIFASLAEPEDERAHDQYVKLIEELATSQKLLEDAKTTHARAQYHVTMLRDQLEKVRGEREETETKLRRLSTAEERADDPVLPQQALAPILAEIERDIDTEDWAKVASKAEGDLRFVWGRVYEVVRLMCKSWKRTLPITLALVVAVAVFAFVVTRFGSRLEAVGVGVVAVTGVIGEFLAVVRKPLTKVRSAAQRLSDLADRMRRADIRERANEADVLRTKLVALQTVEHERTQQVEQAEERAAAAQTALDDVQSGRELQRFLTDRGAGSGYEGYVSLIALVRKDFERLAELLDTTREARKDLPARDELPPVERIILYIDDLDRCPPKQVVDVLQAVHLLLAFPLFVVVVGVDSRWLLQSLRHHYSSQLGEPEVDGIQANEPEWNTTPMNYLEKIFQIPYSLAPMKSGGFRALVNSMMPAPQPSSEHTGDGSTAQQFGGGEVASHDASLDGERSGLVLGSVRPRIVMDLHPDRLSFSDTERTFIGLLTAMVPTPRAAKRLVNVYRIIRATVDDVALNSFVNDDNVAPYRVVLILLGILVGFPQWSQDVVAALLDEAGTATDWWTLLEGAAPKSTRAESRPAGPPRADGHEAPLGAPGAASGERRPETADDLWAAMEPIERAIGRDAPAAPFRTWAPTVARFSFHTARLAAR